MPRLVMYLSITSLFSALQICRGSSMMTNFTVTPSLTWRITLPPSLSPRKGRLPEGQATVPKVCSPEEALLKTTTNIPETSRLRRPRPHKAPAGYKRHALVTLSRDSAQTRFIQHLNSCQVCPLYLRHTVAPAPDLTYDIPERPFAGVSAGVLSGFVTTGSKNRHLLVMTDTSERKRSDGRERILHLVRRVCWYPCK